MDYHKRLQRKPIGASCDFIKEAHISAGPSGDPTRYWSFDPGQTGSSDFESENFTVAPGDDELKLSCLAISCRIQPGPYTYYYPSSGRITRPTAAWWSTPTKGSYTAADGTWNSCGYTADGYFKGIRNDIISIDVWQALKDGLWTSSVQFPIVISVPDVSYKSGYSYGTISARGSHSPITSSSYQVQHQAGSGFLTSCTQIAPISLRVTVYEDGRITIT